MTSQQPTRLLTRHDLEQVLDLDGALAVLDEGFRVDRQHSLRGHRVRCELPGPGSASALLPGLIPSVPAYTAKVNAKFPGATPALRGVICLHDLHTGALLSLLDSGTITAWRTGLAAALATDCLARPSASTVAVVGAGTQADLVVTALAHVIRLDRLSIFDSDRTAAARFAEHHGSIAPVVEVAGTLAACIRSADIIITATWATVPLLGVGDIETGQHVTSLGADEPTKRELEADLLIRGLLVVDDRELATSTGVVASANLTESAPIAIDATFSEVLRREHPGRTADHQITIYSPVGLPWQDLALAWMAYQRAEGAGIGSLTDFFH